MNIKRLIAQNYINFRGWSSRKKYIIFESDDWGSIRMPSKKVYDKLLKKGIKVDSNYFTKYDCLESEQDLEFLFDVLSKYKDINENHPVITAVTIVANPDFDKISRSNKKEYHFELFTDTYMRYPKHSNVLKLWKNDLKLLYPQFHGREHLNIDKWMKSINALSYQEDLAFDNKVLLGIENNDFKGKNANYMAAFEYNNEQQKKNVEIITARGLEIFNTIFGFSSKSFAASGSIRGNHLDKILVENGVLYHQLGQQFIPQPNGVLKKINRYWGDTNSLGQTYWRRNAVFEPSKDSNKDWVNSCLQDINIAFRWGKPAVINSHRVNFSGGISKKNRDNSLKLLDRLLKEIIQIWPDVEFVNSEQLGKIITEPND